MNLGEEQKIIEVEPIEEPQSVPVESPQETPAQEPVPVRQSVPARSLG